MAVFDIARSQIPISPVSNYYQGKALRAGIRAQDLSNQRAEQQIENFDREQERIDRQVDLQERQVEVGEDNVDIRRQEYERLVGAETAKRNAFDLYSIVSTADDLDAASSGLLEWADSLPDAAKDSADAIRQKIKDGDGLTPDELQSIKAVAERNAAYYGFLPQAEKPTTVAKGAALVDSQGNEIYKNVDPADAAGPGGGVKEREIQEYMAMGYNREMAAKFAYDKIRTEVSPHTGRVTRVDDIEGRVWEVSYTGEEVPAIAPEPGKTLWDLSEYATGPASAAKAALNVPLAWAGLPTDKKVTTARQTFKTTNQNFIRALAINTRFPASEQERIREEISLLPGLMDSPSLMRDRMLSIADDLQIRMKQAEQDANNPAWPRDIRERQAINAVEIRNYLAVMGAPPSDADIPAIIKEQGNVEAFRQMSPRMREEYLETFK